MDGNSSKQQAAEHDPNERWIVREGQRLPEPRRDAGYPTMGQGHSELRKETTAGREETTRQRKTGLGKPVEPGQPVEPVEPVKPVKQRWLSRPPDCEQTANHEPRTTVAQQVVDSGAMTQGQANHAPGTHPPPCSDARGQQEVVPSTHGLADKRIAEARGGGRILFFFPPGAAHWPGAVAGLGWTRPDHTGPWQRWSLAMCPRSSQAQRRSGVVVVAVVAAVVVAVVAGGRGGGGRSGDRSARHLCQHPQQHPRQHMLDAP
ncbi:hypothetical protein G7Z17_g10953 [Cylindrodendrum hubeiense]|uniref:Uncharacterized protein n=1 Tax=Cylindrodendrum hubeiense TaxID=595255 RepID=A0A9P5GYH9_9HYPO|nr:hypothetical protein G7Z17_g10953 [Cylindrodendrum hubeiense]